MVSFSVITLGYPSETSGFFIKGGVGGLGAVAESDFDYAETWAWSAETGIGVDVPLGGSAQDYALRSAMSAPSRQGPGSTASKARSRVTPNAIQFGVPHSPSASRDSSSLVSQALADLQSRFTVASDTLHNFGDLLVTESSKEA